MWTRFRVKSSSVTQKEENPQSSPPPPLHPCLCLFSDFMLHVCSSWILPMARALHMSWTISDLKSFCSVCFVSVAVHSALPCTLTSAGTAIFGAVLWPVSGKPSCFFFFFDGWGVGRGRRWSWWEHRTPPCSNSSVSLSGAWGISFECKLWARPAVLSYYWGTYY